MSERVIDLYRSTRCNDCRAPLSRGTKAVFRGAKPHSQIVCLGGCSPAPKVPRTPSVGERWQIKRDETNGRKRGDICYVLSVDGAEIQYKYSATPTRPARMNRGLVSAFLKRHEPYRVVTVVTAVTTLDMNDKVNPNEAEVLRRLADLEGRVSNLEIVLLAGTK